MNFKLVSEVKASVMLSENTNNTRIYRLHPHQPSSPEDSCHMVLFLLHKIRLKKLLSMIY